MRFLAAAGLVMILAGLGAYYATAKELSAFSIVNVAGGALALVAAGVVQVRQIRGFSGALSRRLALRWTAILVAVFTIAIGATIMSAGWNTTIDLSIERSYTLSSHTVAICDSLPADAAESVELLFFEDVKLSKERELLIRAYRATCPALRIRFLPVAEAPPAAQVILARTETTVVTCRGDRCERVGFPSEENISNAIQRLVRRREIVAYFLLGHGEVNLADETDDGYSGLAAVLRAEGIEPRGWLGPASGEIPGRADIVVVAAPQVDLLPAEIDALEGWLETGGRLLVLLEPGIESNIDELLERWGFDLPEGVVADSLHSPLLETPDELTLLLGSYDSSHPIVRPFDLRTLVVLPGARVVARKRKPEPEDRLNNLAYSSRGSWLETDTQSALRGLPIAPDPDEPQGRELPVAAAGRYPRGDTETRIVVIGDRDFVSNQHLGSLYNRDLLMNAVWWLAEDERWTTIRSKEWTAPQDPLTIQETLSYFYFFAFALPEVLLLFGIAAWYRQRA